MLIIFTGSCKATLPLIVSMIYHLQNAITVELQVLDLFFLKKEQTITNCFQLITKLQHFCPD